MGMTSLTGSAASALPLETSHWFSTYDSEETVNNKGPTCTLFDAEFKYQHNSCTLKTDQCFIIGKRKNIVETKGVLENWKTFYLLISLI